MNRIVFVAFTLIVVSYFSFLATVAHAQPCCEPYAKELTFVADHDELNVALEAAEQGTVGSVAISEKYYQEGTSKTQKDLIRGLIARTFELGNRAVYIYSQPLNNELARELLGDSIGCAPAYARGRITGKVNGSMCFMAGEAMSEDTMRKGLRDYEVLRNGGI